MSSILHRGAWIAVWMALSGLAQAMPGATTTRTVSLAELGLRDAISLTAADNERHYFIPVPSPDLLESGRITLAGRYFQAWDEDAVLTVLVNGEPLLTRPLRPAVPAGTAGGPQSGAIDSGLSVEVTQAIRHASLAGEFLDVGLVLGSRVRADHCVDERGRGNTLVLDPAALTLTYTYRSGDRVDVRRFLATLPRRVDVLLPPGELTPAQYETALSVARGLADLGLSTRFLTLPREGDVVPMDRIDPDLPWDHISGAEQLREAVAKGQPFKLANAGEVAGWITARMLSSEGLSQVVIDPAATKRHLLAAMARSPADPSVEVLLGKPDDWVFEAAQDHTNLSVGRVAGRSLLMVEDTAAARMIGSVWRQVAAAGELGIATTEPARTPPADDMRLLREPLTRDIGVQDEWRLPLRLADFAPGKWPDVVELDLVAAPDADGRPATASVFFNDTLLVSSPLSADGKPDSLRAPVPLYAVRADNTLRVQVSRRPDATGCARAGQGRPVQLLPTSVVSTRDAPASSQFYMLQPVLGRGVDVVIPAEWLQRASDTLPTVDGILAGFSLPATSLSVTASESGVFMPRRPFVAFDVQPQGAVLTVNAEHSRLQVRDRKGRTVFDSSGLSGLSVLELTEVQGVSGVHVSAVGGRYPVQPPTQRYSEGNFVISDQTGELLSLDLDDPDALYHVGDGYRWMQRYAQHWRVLLAGLLLIGVPVILVLSTRAYIRRRHAGGF